MLGYIAWLEIATGVGMVCFAFTRSREVLAVYAALGRRKAGCLR